MTERYMTVENNTPTDTPHGKPVRIEIEPGVTVGCAHWPDEELARYGVYPCPATFDPAIQHETGYTFNAKAGRCEATLEPRDLAEVQAELLDAIDRAAETERLRYITPGAGQALVYREKMREAVAMAGDAEPGVDNYPLAAARATRLGMTIAAVGAEWKAMADAWIAMAAAIETVRETAKEAISAAATPAEVVTAATVTWPAGPAVSSETAEPTRRQRGSRNTNTDTNTDTETQ